MNKLDKLRVEFRLLSREQYAKKYLTGPKKGEHCMITFVRHGAKETPETAAITSYIDAHYTDADLGYNPVRRKYKYRNLMKAPLELIPWYESLGVSVKVFYK